MLDMNPSELNLLILKSISIGVYVSVIGIGLDFNSALTETLTKNEGCNYYCITKEEEMRETMVDDFHYNFLVSAFNMYLKI